MKGTSATAFSPAMDTTRGMLATLLWRLDGRNTPAAQSGFPDVSENQWYADAVHWAASTGVVTGYSSGNFSPNDPITREQMVLMLHRYAKATATAGDLSAFTDAANVSDWARDAVGWAVNQGILTGKDGARLDPGGKATRAEVAAMLMRYCGADL